MSTDLQDRLATWLSHQGPSGAAFEDLRGAFPDASDNALRYRLRLLRESGALRVEGTTRAARYISSTPSPTPPLQETLPPSPDDALFSPQSLTLIAAITRPLHTRPIASYESSWVEGHLGRKALLSEAERERLHALGRTSQQSAPAGTYARQVYERLLIDLSWASSSLEGNTYTLLDTQHLIERGIAAEGHDALEAQMILNHKRGIEFLLEDALPLGLVRRVVSNLHAVLMENLLHDPSTLGAIRHHPVGISGSTYSPPSSPQRLSEELELLLAATRRLHDPFEQSLRLLIHLPYLQPFLDGNKRTARVLANLPLFEQNVKPLSFIDVPRDAYLRAILCIYELRDPRPMIDLFLWAYERSCQRYPDITSQLPAPDPFRLAHRDQLHDAIRLLVTSLEANPEARLTSLAASLFDEPLLQDRFIALALADLAALHEGNFMRYRLRPSEFDAWLTRAS